MNRIHRPAMPRLQKVCNGWIAVPQWDTENFHDWYGADKELFASYISEAIETDWGRDLTLSKDLI